MITAVVDGHPHIGSRISCQYAFTKGFINALLNRGNIVLRYSTANDLINELTATPGWQRFNLKKHMPVLTMATRLFLMFIFRLG